MYYSFHNSIIFSRYVSRVMEYHKKSFQHLTMFFMRGLQKYAKNKIFTISFWATYKIGQPIQPIWQQCCVLSCLPWKSHQIYFIFLNASRQVEIKNVVKCWKNICFILLLWKHRPGISIKYFLLFSQNLQLYQKSHLALDNLAKLVFWSILSFKNWKVNT